MMASPVNLADHEALGAAALDPPARAYFAGAAGDEHTLHANRRAWDEIPLLPRVLRPLAGGHTRIPLFGRTLRHPILVAPVAYQRIAHPDGEVAMALAASAQEAGLVLSSQSSVTLETVAQAVRDDAARGPLWFQLYLLGDRGFDRRLVQRAEAAGYEALVLTVDAPCHGARDRERRAAFRLPPGIRAVHLDGLERAAPPDLPASASPLFDHLLLRAPGWDDVAWLRSQTRLPLLLKGILHPEDAREAVRHGADGIIVSNHGGRTLDMAVPTAHALRAVVEAVGDSLPVLVDGGVRRGTDVFKALAFGARAVLVGRPCVLALAHGGPAAVAQVLRLLRDELEIAMALMGCRTVADIRPECLLPARAGFMARGSLVS